MCRTSWPHDGATYGCHPLNSSPSSSAYMRQWLGSALVQIMAWRLFGAKPLSKPTLGYCQLDPKEQTSVKFQSKYKTFHSRKRTWKYRLRKGGHFVPGEMSLNYAAMIAVGWPGPHVDNHRSYGTGLSSLVEPTNMSGVTLSCWSQNCQYVCLRHQGPDSI